jgi:hypothetical protein
MVVRLLDLDWKAPFPQRSFPEEIVVAWGRPVRFYAGFRSSQRTCVNSENIFLDRRTGWRGFTAKALAFV